LPQAKPAAECRNFRDSLSGFITSLKSKESIMSSTATKKKSAVEVFPPILGCWSLTVSNDPNLGMLDSIEVTASVRAVDHVFIFGSVKSDLPVTAYALEDGKIMISDGAVSFQLRIEGIVYQFTGQFDGTEVTGTVNNPDPSATGGLGTEEGSWSAQAQLGPGEEEEKKHPGKHKNRSAR
jgi:hypothetical protein